MRSKVGVSTGPGLITFTRAACERRFARCDDMRELKADDLAIERDGPVEIAHSQVHVEEAFNGNQRAASRRLPSAGRRLHQRCALDGGRDGVRPFPVHAEGEQ